MKRHWVMRSVVRRFTNENNVPRFELECGHIKTDPMWYYGNEKAKAIIRAFKDMTGETLRVRCYKCAQNQATT